MSFPRSLVLVAAIGCGLTTVEASRGDDKPPAVDAPIKAVVAHLAKKGIKLEADERGWWVVADPKGDGYQVIVHLRTFPADATEQEMRDALKTINLAYILNAPSRVAMSHPGLRLTNAGKKPPKLDQLPVAANLKKHFNEYRPPEPKK